MQGLFQKSNYYLSLPKAVTCLLNN
uniref:Uncharacterized protein n=1 Tax=Anguilla anguilla TaxID=7936 RepID=A0A0E9P9I9_ANGAN